MEEMGVSDGREEKRTVCAHAPLQIRDLRQRRILPARPEEISQGGAIHAAVAALVEELEGFAVVGGGLLGVRMRIRIHGLQCVCVCRCAAVRAQRKRACAERYV